MASYCDHRRSITRRVHMQHIPLGRTGLQVSRLCLGTMTFGLQCDEATSRAILDTAAEAGITFIDTADVYPLGDTLDTVGRTEEIIGRWLEGRRDQFILATKCANKVGPAPWQQGASRKHVLWAVDASLKRLGRLRRCSISSTLALLAPARVRYGERAGRDREGARGIAGHADSRLGARESRDHVSDHRRDPAGATRPPSRGRGPTAQAGGTEPGRLSAALSSVKDWVEQRLG